MDITKEEEYIFRMDSPTLCIVYAESDQQGGVSVTFNDGTTSIFSASLLGAMRAPIREHDALTSTRKRGGVFGVRPEPRSN